MVTERGQQADAVHMLISDWLLVDGTIDNHIQSAAEQQQASVVTLGHSIRQAGWDQIPGWPHDLAGFDTWPAPGQTTTITLTAAQWRLVLSALRYWAEVSDRLSDAAGAARDRTIATTIEQQLAEQGPPQPP